MTAIQLLVEVVDPVVLGVTSAVSNIETDPIFAASEAANFEAGDKTKLDTLQAITWGAKQTGVDGGALFQMSIDDDYLYVCVFHGGVGEAIWKKTLLFNT